jgi:prepilin-type N-terminal cleavage/methylation domain-containing protein
MKEMKWMFLKFKQGFTMSELLIGLGILGLIAAFSVPKLLNVSNAALANAKVHKAAQAVVNGLEKWTQENGRSASTTPANIMNVVQHNGLITDGRSVDWTPGTSDDFTCVTNPAADHESSCYQMPDGSVLFFILHWSSADFTSFGTSPENSLYFGVDPDGIVTEDTSRSSTSNTTAFYLSFNGRLRERGRLKDGSNTLQPQWTPTYYQQ